MGLFGLGKGKTAGEKLLVEAIAHNAQIIRQTEGKSRADAEYLSICALLDDLKERPNGGQGWRDTMAIVQRDYPQHLSDVVTYVGWSSGELKLSPQAEAALKQRHAKSGAPLRLEQLSGFNEFEIQQIISAQLAECINAISEKWLYYNEMLKFKPDVPLTEIIEGFAIPMSEFVTASYPIIGTAGSETFWLAVFRGIQQTRAPSLAAVNAAITELDARLRSPKFDSR